MDLAERMQAQQISHCFRAEDRPEALSIAWFCLGLPCELGKPTREQQERSQSERRWFLKESTHICFATIRWLNRQHNQPQLWQAAIVCSYVPGWCEHLLGYWNSVVYVMFTTLSVQLWWAKNRQKYPWRVDLLTECTTECACHMAIILVHTHPTWTTRPFPPPEDSLGTRLGE